MADPRDGLLSLVLARELSRLGVVLILPSLLLGRHLGHPQILFLPGREVAVEFPHPVPAHADGELLPEASRYRAEVKPLGLKVVGRRASVRGENPAVSPAPA
jgi:diacylglycerol kinase family enzyme